MTPTSRPLALVVRFTLLPDAEHEFDKLVARTVEQIAEHEPGTLIYTCHTDPQADPPARIFYELYASQAAFDAHEHQPYVRQFLAQREQLVSHTKVTFLDLDASAVSLTGQLT